MVQVTRTAFPLQLAHFAFYRAYLEGTGALDLPALADRYLGIGRDPRRALTALEQVRDELVRIARRCGDHDALRMLKLPRLIGSPSPLTADSEPGLTDAPSLEAFRAMVDPGDVYAEVELRGLYRDRYPASPTLRKRRRDSRLIQRRSQALQRLEGRVADAPDRTDPVSGWFDHALTARLERAGLRTLGCTIDAINRDGFRWYAGVPGLGPRGAARVVGWLATNASGLGGLTPRATQPLRHVTSDTLSAERKRTVAEGELAPLEWFRLPQRNMIASSTDEPRESGRPVIPNDQTAVLSWLAHLRARREISEHTWRAYRTQAERVLLWSATQRQKRFADITNGEIQDYLRFLANPPPDWIGPKAIPRWSPAWRPMTAPVSSRSMVTVVAVLRVMFAWFTTMRYITVSPFRAKSTRCHRIASSVGNAPNSGPVPLPDQAKTSVTPSLAWCDVQHFLAQLPQNEDQARLKAVVFLIAHAGMRLSDIAGASCSDLQPMIEIDPATPTDPAGRPSRWRLRVVDARRGTARFVPLSSDVYQSLCAYLHYRGIGVGQCTDGGDSPLIGRLGVTSSAHLTAAALERRVRTLFRDLACNVREAGNSDYAASIENARAYSLRQAHTRALVSQGVPLAVVGARMGYRSRTTMARYARNRIDS